MSQCLWIGLRVTVVQNVGVRTTALADATSAVGAAALIAATKVDQLVAPVLLHQYEQLLLESFSYPVSACVTTANSTLEECTLSSTGVCAASEASSNNSAVLVSYTQRL
jgi:hypothetical protein